MATTLENFDPEDPGEGTVELDPAEDITLEDLGEDKELNTPPEDEPEEAEGPDQEEPEEDKSEEAEEEESEAEAEKEKEQKADQAAQKTDAEKTTEEILKHLGMDSPLKIKGKDYKLSDFANDDILAFIQKGIRMTQVGTELSQREARVAEREKVAEANVLKATQILQSNRPAEGTATKVETEPPKELQPSEYDTDDVKAVKQAALSVWKQSQEQAQRLSTIEGGLKNQQSEAESQRFLDDLQTHKADFPLASVEEVIAVHTLRPDIPLSELVRRSHAIYGSVDHVESVFKHAPEVRKHFEDKIVAAYLAKNKAAKVIPQKPTTQGARQTPTTKAKIRSFDDAGQAARKALSRMAKELEDDSD